VFPSAWVFIFWLIWPRIVLKQTQKFMLLLGGQTMSEEHAEKLRSALTEITRAIPKDRAARTTPQDLS
jgi:hypothetical protein